MSFCFTVISGCQKSKNPDEVLIEDFHSYFNTIVQQNLDDPKSYELIGTVIIDTVTYAEYWNKLIKIHTDQLFYNEKHYNDMKNIYNSAVKTNKELARFSSPEQRKINKEREDKYLEDISRYKADWDKTKFEIDSLNSKIKDEGSANIFSIELIHSFRAKNKLGALVKDDVRVSYYPDVTDESKKYYIKSK